MNGIVNVRLACDPISRSSGRHRALLSPRSLQDLRSCTSTGERVESSASSVAPARCRTSTSWSICRHRQVRSSSEYERRGDREDLPNERLRDSCLSRAAVPHLIKTGGSIINISSIAAGNTTLGQTAYGSSKAAVDLTSRVASPLNMGRAAFESTRSYLDRRRRT